MGFFTRKIEGAISFLWPSWARTRAFDRAKAEHFRQMETSSAYRETFFAMMGARGYRAARTAKTNTPFGGGAGSADSQIINDLPTLISRSREINRDDPIGGGITKTFVHNIIGEGIRPQARTDNPDRDKKIEEVWSERKDELDPANDLGYSEHQRLVLRKVIEDGGVFVKKARAKTGEPVWFEVIEKDRVMTPGDKSQDKKIRDGVKRDEYGRIVSYFVCKNHPGDGLGVSLKPEDFTEVPKEAMRHLRIVDRPGQTHGVPLFASILQDLRDLDLLILAALKRVQIAACLAVFIQSEETTSELFDATAQTYGYKLDQDLEPGMIFRLFPNEKIDTLIPNFPVPELGEFIIMLARRIGSALGISWQIVLKDFSRSNYSAARSDLLESRQVFIVLQKWLIEKLFNWQWKIVLEDAKLRDDNRLAKVPIADLAKVHWIAPGWRWVDPAKEALATKIELRLNITTLRDVCASQGKDWEETLKQRIKEEELEMKLREQAGLPEKQPEKDTDKEYIKEIEGLEEKSDGDAIDLKWLKTEKKEVA